MNSYRIFYSNGTTEDLMADDYDYNGREYIFYLPGGSKYTIQADIVVKVVKF